MESSTRPPLSTPTRDRRSVLARVDGFSGFVLFILIVIPSFAIFFATAQKVTPFHIDPFTNAVASWNLTEHGTVVLREHAEFHGPEYYQSVGWFVEGERGTVAMYPPGTALWAAPFYALGPSTPVTVSGIAANNRDLGVVDLPVPPLGTAAAAASLSVALAIGWVGLTIRTMAPNRHALAAAYVTGFGTTAWAVASDQLWQHGPAMMWLALAAFLMSRSQQWAAGFAFGLAVLTRPLTAVVAAGSGLAQAWRTRSLAPAIRVGVGAATGLAALTWYNVWAFGSASVAGGYSDGLVTNVVDSDVGWYLGNALGGLFDPTRGLLVWSPFLIVLLFGVRAGWGAAPPWARGAAIGAVAYLLIHWKANRFSGGDGFYGYRYPLEALMAAVPLLYLAYRERVAERPILRTAFRLTTTSAVVLQAAVVLL